LEGFDSFSRDQVMNNASSDGPALLIIDLVKDVLDPKKNLPITPLAGRIIEPINRLAESFRRASRPVVFATDSFRPEDFIFTGKMKPYSLEGTRGAEVADDLKRAEEDWGVACDLVDRTRVRHGLFFANLALEKAMKALVCRKTRDIAPRMHNLVRLAEVAGLKLQPSQLDVLAEMNSFNIEGRYPDSPSAPPSLLEARGYLKKAEEVFQWLMHLWLRASETT
jgi:HEPN domain-containing protein